MTDPRVLRLNAGSLSLRGPIETRIGRSSGAPVCVQIAPGPLRPYVDGLAVVASWLIHLSGPGWAEREGAVARTWTLCVPLSPGEKVREGLRLSWARLTIDSGRARG